MEGFVEAFSAGVDAIDGFVWGWAMIVLLLGTHLFMTIRTKFIQRKLGTAIKLSFTAQDTESEGDVSQFGALTTALAATIGTGNIVGVATGLFFGGPGAIFWMWITGIFGIATKYAETFISVKYRVKDHRGEMLGGAMYALERGFKHKKLGKVLAVLFALFAFIASFGIGASVQSNSLSGVITAYIPFDSPEQLVGANAMIGVFLVILVGVVIFGGIKSITRVTEKLVPVMALLYAAGCIVIIGMNWQFVGDALGLIVTCAFSGQAAFGGAVGSGIALALQYGFKRGLFSNESGMGSAPLVASAAQTRNPVRQALVSATGTFWDTVVVCLMTGLVLVSTIMKNPNINMDTIENGGQMTTAAFSQIPYIGPAILVFSIITFAYSTILGWSYYGERAAEYLLGRKAILPYKVIFTAIVVLGPVLALDLVWTIADVLNALMAIPNLVAVLLLSGVIAKETRHYLANLDEKDTAEIPVVRR